MKYLKFLLPLTLAVVVVAEAAFSIDFRYHLSWTDPNPLGLVSTWNIFATNLAGVRQIVSVTTNNVDLFPLFNGAPSGSYTLYTTAVSTTGAESDPGDSIVVVWPGGNGRPRGGVGPRVNR